MNVTKPKGQQLYSELLTLVIFCVAYHLILSDIPVFHLMLHIIHSTILRTEVEL